MTEKLVHFGNDVSALFLKQVLSLIILFFVVGALVLYLKECLDVLIESVHRIPLNIYDFMH